jgi:radical SAM superfamily enzyme YgiQ (UPF0313 family)
MSPNVELTNATLSRQEIAYSELLDKFQTPKELILIAPMQVPESVFDCETANRQGYFNYPPVGLLYIASVAKKVDPGIEIKIIDLNLELLRRAQNDNFNYRFWEKYLSEIIENCHSPYIGISCMFDVNKEVFIQISQFLRKNFPDAPILGGGVQATYDYEELLREGDFDFIFRKESEGQFEVFLENICKGDLNRKPKGISFVNCDQVYKLGEPLEDIPVEIDIRDAYSLIPIEEYYRFGGLAVFSRFNGKEKPFATVLSNRGCRAYCTFCTVRDFNGKGIRARTVEGVIDEIKFLWSKGIRQIDWLDDDFLWDRGRTLHLLKRMVEEVPDMEWISNNGLIAAAIDEEIMEWMVKSGLKALKVGIESGNNAMLKKIKKPTSKRKLLMASALFKKYPKVFYSGNFIIGFPDETFGEMMDSLNFAKQLGWDWASFYICQPLVGTEMYSMFRDLGVQQIEGEDATKALNPGRLAQRGEFGLNFDKQDDVILRGRDIYKLPLDIVPSGEQLNEIWFTFNFDINFSKNPHLNAGTELDKTVRWFKSILAGYPHDASMSAALTWGNRLMNNSKESKMYQDNVVNILSNSAYWRRRSEEFPEILQMAGL